MRWKILIAAVSMVFVFQAPARASVVVFDSKVEMALGISHLSPDTQPGPDAHSGHDVALPAPENSGRQADDSPRDTAYDSMSVVISAGLDDIVFAPSVVAVPEPSTWAMMLLGLAGIGFVGYRRSRKDALLAFATAGRAR